MIIYIRYGSSFKMSFNNKSLWFLYFINILIYNLIILIIIIIIIILFVFIHIFIIINIIINIIWFQIHLTFM